MVAATVEDRVKFNVMNITVNGESRTIDPETSLEDLVDTLGLGEKRIAVEVNREIVPRSEYNNCKLSESDTVEIVNAIGGG
jgi:thiamine biosynthesis protein ThiS